MMRLFNTPVNAKGRAPQPRVGPGLNIKAPAATGFSGMPQPSFLEAYWPVNIGQDGRPKGWTFGPIDTSGTGRMNVDESGVKG